MLPSGILRTRSSQMERDELAVLLSGVTAGKSCPEKQKVWGYKISGVVHARHENSKVVVEAEYELHGALEEQLFGRHHVMMVSKHYSNVPLFRHSAAPLPRCRRTGSLFACGAEAVYQTFVLTSLYWCGIVRREVTHPPG